MYDNVSSSVRSSPALRAPLTGGQGREGGEEGGEEGDAPTREMSFLMKYDVVANAAEYTRRLPAHNVHGSAFLAGSGAP